MTTPYQQNAKTPAGPIASTPAGATWGGFRGLLKQYSGAAAGYSLRKIGNGPVVRLRRASDSAEKDFSAGEVEAGTAGAELVTNGDFATDTDWTKGTGWSITGGQAVNDGSQVSPSYLSQDSVMSSVVIGEYYILSFDVVSCSNFTNAGLLIDSNFFIGFAGGTQISATGSYSVLWKYTGTNTNFRFWADAGVTLTIDNVSFKPYTPNSAELWVNNDRAFSRQNTESSFCTTWYDQSGSGNDATQATAASQPLLIRAGVTNTENGKAALSFDGSDDVFSVTTDISSGLSAHSAFATSNLTYDRSAYFVRKVAGTNPQAIISGINRLYNDGSSWRGAGGELGLGSQNLGTWLLPGSSNNSGYSNGVEVESGVAGNQIALDGSDAAIGIGGTAAGGSNITGNVQELIIYPSDQDSNRIGIEENIADNYEMPYPTQDIVSDYMPTPAAAYSLRSLDGDATANVVRLRRASDNEERDFTAADLVGGVEGAELITNGDFSSGSTGWTLATEWSIVGGQAVLDGTQTSNALLRQESVPGFAGVQGIFKYTFDITCSNYTSFQIQIPSAVPTASQLEITADGTYSIIFDTRAGTGNWGNLSFYTATTGVTATIDNVSLVPYTPTAAEQWVIDDAGLVFSGSGATEQNTNSALVTTLYDQAASNEQVFDDPAITGSWTDTGNVVTTSGLIRFTNVTNATNATSTAANIPAGTYRIEVDYENCTRADRFAVGLNGVANAFNIPAGSGTVSGIYTFASSGAARVAAVISLSGESVDITGVRFTNIGNPATQTTSTAQPKLITAGVTELENGKPAMVFDGTDDELTVSYSPSDYPITQAVVARGDAANAGYALSLHLSGQADEYLTGSPVDASAVAIYSVRTTGSSANPSNAITANDYTLVFSYSSSSTSHSTHLNGGAAATSATSVTFPAPDTLAIGNLRDSSPLYFTGKIQEAIVYPSDQSANRTILETNINNHYGIY